MLISLAWLRELVVLPADDDAIARRLTARGLTVDAQTSLPGDTVLDIDVPANRPDALGHLGVAREVAAAFGATLTGRPGPPEGRGAATTDAVSVTIQDPALCGRYTARVVRGVRIGPSPAWVVARLAACGQRSINNVVDISNLVMLELGQPVHFFDLARIPGRSVTVRAARAGERLTTLDGIDRALVPGMIVIADGETPLALGGIMGGAASQITDHTSDVLIEAAWFSPSAVRQAARALGLSTDASQRFERGGDLEAPPSAQDLAVRLLSSLAGGVPAPGLLDVRSRPREVRALAVRPARAARLLGYALTPEEAEGALRELGYHPRKTADAIEVTVPSWRVDLEREADLVEEIGRHLGYDRIPEQRPAAAPRPASASRAAALEDVVRDRLAALGFHEAFSYAMIGPGEDDAFVSEGTPGSIALANPIAETLGFLRRTLLPGLLRATDQNLRRDAGAVRLFEVGAVFHARGPGELPEEPSRAGFAWCGDATPPHWSGPSRALDAWDAAGLIEDLLSTAAGGRALARASSDLTGLHPGKSMLWRDDLGRRVAWCGLLHPDEAARRGLTVEVWLGEVDLGLAAASQAAATVYRPIARVPGTWRDLSIVLPPGTPSGSVLAALRAIPSPAPASMTWIDRYSGPPLAEGAVAMTLRVILQPLDRTLNDAEAEAYRSQLVGALESVPGVRLRRIDT